MATLGQGGAQVWATASGGKMYGSNALTTAPLQVVPANPQRQRLTFHNPGAVDFLVYPAKNFNGDVITPDTANRGFSFLVFANGGTLVIQGECQTAWLAISVSGTLNPITVMDSNVA